MCDQAPGQRGEWESGSHLLLRIMALASRVAALENGAGWGEGEGTRMARPLRIEYESACYHVMNRGNGRRVFHGDDDYGLFLEKLARPVETFRLSLRAFTSTSGLFCPR